MTTTDKRIKQKGKTMKTLTDSRAKRAVIGIGAVALLAFVSVAGAMQEYEDLKVFVAEIESDLQKADQHVCDLERLGILQFTFGIEQLSQILDQVDKLECQALSALSAAATEAEAAGNEAAGTRVRKQMQKIKQAAQEVRNRILEIRSIPFVPITVMALDVCAMPVLMEIGMYV